MANCNTERAETHLKSQRDKINKTLRTNESSLDLMAAIIIEIKRGSCE